jgi:hypothetical protein
MLRNSDTMISPLDDKSIRSDRRENLGDCDFGRLLQQARTEYELGNLRTEENETNGYINGPTEKIVAELDEHIYKRGDLVQSSRVIESFTAFKCMCRKPPSIVEYIRNKTDCANPAAGFTVDQIKLIWLSMVARSSPTWATIQSEPGLLSLTGDHDTAAIINSNAMNETGDKAHRPHPLLLYDCFAELGKALHFDALTPASYHLVRQIHRLRQLRNDGKCSDVNVIYKFLNDRRIYIEHTPRDMQSAIDYADLSPPSLVDYHSQILRDVLGLDDRGCTAPVHRSPYDLDWMAMRGLELAAREASSVDEHDTGRLSYIGAGGMVVDALLGYVPAANRNAVLAWTRAHNDEATGQSVGWQGAAEEGHADDARITAMDILKTLDPEPFAQTLEAVTKLGNARLAFWDHVVVALEAKEHVGERIPVRRACV